MQCSIVSLVALALLCASQCSNAFGSDAEQGCTNGACYTAGIDEGSEETALIQRKIKEHSQEAQLDGKKFPDLGGLKDTVQDAVGNVKDAAEDLQVGALTKFADAVDDKLKDMKDQVKPFAKQVNSSAEDLKKGIATTLAEYLNVTIDGIPTAKKYEDIASEMLSKTDSVWSTVSIAIEGASKAIDGGLAAMGSSAGDLRKKVNATMQGALSSGKGVLEAISTLSKTMKEAKSKAESKVKEATSDLAKDDSLLQTKMDPTELLTTLTKAAGDASEQASTFAESFSDSFGTLSKEVTESVEENLSADDLSKVHKAFEHVQESATELANQVLSSSKQILGSVTEATAAAGDAAGIKSGAAGQPLARWGLSVAAAAVFAAISI